MFWELQRNVSVSANTVMKRKEVLHALQQIYLIYLYNNAHSIYTTGLSNLTLFERPEVLASIPFLSSLSQGFGLGQF